LVGNQCNDSAAHGNQPSSAFVLKYRVERLFDGFSILADDSASLDPRIYLIKQSRLGNLDRRVRERALEQLQQRRVELRARNSFGSHGGGPQDFASMIHDEEFAPILGGQLRRTAEFFRWENRRKEICRNSRQPKRPNMSTIDFSTGIFESTEKDFLGLSLPTSQESLVSLDLHQGFKQLPSSTAP
jgi:hypothetical protein